MHCQTWGILYNLDFILSFEYGDCCPIFVKHVQATIIFLLLYAIISVKIATNKNQIDTFYTFYINKIIF